MSYWRYLASVGLILLGLFGSSFLGFMHDGEFGESTIGFVKNRPSVQMNFYPPHAQEDLYIMDLPANEQEAELAHYMEESGEGFSRFVII